MSNLYQHFERAIVFTVISELIKAGHEIFVNLDHGGEGGWSVDADDILSQVYFGSGGEIFTRKSFSPSDGQLYQPETTFETLGFVCFTFGDGKDVISGYSWALKEVIDPILHGEIDVLVKAEL